MAATGATPTVKQVDKVQLRVMVNKESNKVVYAEAGKDFVDVLLSFLTLPLGTIAKLVAQESNIEAVRVGSLSSLYQSVADIDEQYLSTPACKEMLLNPRNSMAEYCSKLKLNIDETQPMQYFRCTTWNCNRRDSGSPLTTFKIQKCICGKVMDKEEFPECLNVENGFVKEAASFIISDDLHVMPNVFSTTMRLLQKLEVVNNNAIQEQTVDISKKEVVDLLKLSLLSETPLTDFIFNNKQFLGISRLQNRNLSDFDFKKAVSADDGKHIDLKVIVRKSNGEILLAQGEEDFVDFLLSFLVFPLGGVLHILKGFTSLGCLYNLYESMKQLSPDRYLISQDVIEKLTKPKIAPQFNLNSQILPIDAASLPVFFCNSYIDGCGFFFHLSKDVGHHTFTFNGMKFEKSVRFNFDDPKSPLSKSSSSGEFVKGPSTYMVSDDLVVTPISSAYVTSYLNRSNVPLLDLEEKLIKIGRKEGLAILKASLISPTGLTDSLSQFITTNKDSAKNITI